MSVEQERGLGAGTGKEEIGVSISRRDGDVAA